MPASRAPLALGLLIVLLPPAKAQTPTFLRDSLTLPAGCTAMVPVRLDAAAEQDFRADPANSDAAVIEVIRPAEVLRGGTLGFLRIRTLAPGAADLRLGDASLELTVTPPPAEADPQSQPRFTTPAEGAALQGVVAIGVEVQAGALVQRPGRLRLHLPDNRLLEPISVVDPTFSPFSRALFELDCGSLPAGPAALVAEWVDDRGQAVASAPLAVTILGPDPAATVARGEAETETAKPDPAKPGWENTNLPAVEIDPDASGGACVELQDGGQTWTAAVEVPATGRYQLFVRARGTLAAAAFPSLTWMNPEERKDLTGTIAASPRWHRLALGRPVVLEAGSRLIPIRLSNHTRRARSGDRRACLDSFELVRVDASAAVPTSADAMVMAGDEAMMAGSEAMMAAAPADQAGPLHAGWINLFDGQGAIQTARLVARGEWEGQQDGNRRNQVYLEIFRRDDPADPAAVTRIAHGYGDWIAFDVPLWRLKPGANELFVRAGAPGRAPVDGPSQTLLLQETHPSRPEWAWEESWRPVGQQGKWVNHELTDLVDGDPARDEQHHRAQRFVPGDARVIEYSLEDWRDGIYRIGAEIRGHGRLQLAWRDGRGVEHPLSAVTATPDRWQAAYSEPVDLPRGAKTLLLRTEIPAGLPPESPPPAPAAIDASPSDTLAASPPAPALLLHRIGIERQAAVDVQPPQVALIHPAPGAAVEPDLDGIVARLADDRDLKEVRILLDGEPLGRSVRIDQRFGPLVLPLNTRALEPGSRHRIALEVTDHAGHGTRSEEREIVVAAAGREALTTPFGRARHLLLRTGYGFDPLQLAAILEQGEGPWLHAQLAAPATDPLALPSRRRSELLHRPRANDYHLRGRIIDQMISSPQPARTRFVAWVDNHFSTWVAKSGAGAEVAQWERFDALGAARFADLLRASSTSSAMIVYLDQQNSVAEGLNENFARELLELHSVGVHAGYSQADVTAVAHLLTGWGAQQEMIDAEGRIEAQFRYDQLVSENAPLRAFGLELSPAVSGQPDERIVILLESLAARPAAAEFITGKLLAHYHGEPLDEELHRTLVDTYLRRGGDLAAVLEALVAHPHFWSDPRQRVLSPVEFGAALLRPTRATESHRVIELGQASGRQLLDRESPDGYPDRDNTWADTNVQLQRWHFADAVRNALAEDIPPQLIQRSCLASAEGRQQLIDWLSLRLLGRPLGPRSAEAAQILLSTVPAATDRNELAKDLAAFVAMTPEAQLR